MGNLVIWKPNLRKLHVIHNKISLNTIFSSGEESHQEIRSFLEILNRSNKILILNHPSFHEFNMIAQQQKGNIALSSWWCYAISVAHRGSWSPMNTTSPLVCPLVVLSELPCPALNTSSLVSLSSCQPFVSNLAVKALFSLNMDRSS